MRVSQHGPGPKHQRPIVLESWQERFALDDHPQHLLCGLIHSDGYRGMNPILGGRYAYPCYQFSNRSTGIARDDVALLDSFVGPKR